MIYAYIADLAMALQPLHHPDKPGGVEGSQRRGDSGYEPAHHPDKPGGVDWELLTAACDCTQMVQKSRPEEADRRRLAGNSGGRVPMKPDLFHELVESVREGADILKGRIKPSRTFVIEGPDIKRIPEGYRLSQTQ